MGMGILSTARLRSRIQFDSFNHCFLWNEISHSMKRFCAFVTHLIEEIFREGANTMGYVPGQKHDLFFSYAHGDDAAWIGAFQRSLCQGLEERLGSRVSVW